MATLKDPELAQLSQNPKPRVYLTEEEDELGSRHLVLNMGPQHPATHGTLRVILETNGERVVKADSEIGYLHTGFEKLGEHMTYTQFITVTDRMNYISAINNNVGYAIACEELLGISPPERGQVLRVILAEISRLADHVLCAGLQAMDMGAFSVMLWCFEKREKIYDILEHVCGARLTTSYTRIGGLFRDVPEDFPDLVSAFLKDFPPVIDELETMLVGNRIFEDRLRGIGVITRAEAVDWGISGPVARASGLEVDVRKSRPYSGYERYQFDVPVQADGDCWARFIQRIEEMRQSLRIIEQALKELPGGPVNIHNKKLNLPDKKEVFDNIESLIHHFMQIMLGHGIQPKRGAEIYSATEAPNGELGFYLVSDGEMNPYRVRVRPPSLYNYAIFTKLCEGAMISDVVAILSSLNIIAGELDR
ncbi:MAG: NADH-quinone oxidoreductase subunit D [Planctomycetes bacterium]|nr:NADH-quinone oxidoreductase subunit D [Planctomycetota bacterium]